MTANLCNRWTARPADWSRPLSCLGSVALVALLGWAEPSLAQDDGSAGYGTSDFGTTSVSPSSGQGFGTEATGSDHGEHATVEPVGSSLLPPVPGQVQGQVQGQAQVQAQGQIAGDTVGPLIDAPDGAEGLIKAPAALSGAPEGQNAATLPAAEAFGGAASDATSDLAEEAQEGAAPEGFASDMQAEMPAAAEADASLKDAPPNDPLAGDPLAGATSNSFLPQGLTKSARVGGRDIGPQAHSPVVVELFTSQGCSSCPPADEMLSDLADRPDVLALSWHVDYWDYLGWADEFARPEFTLRQKQYARAAGERSIYTPQIIIGGSDTLIDLRPAELMAMIENQQARPVALSVTARTVDGSYQIELTPRSSVKGGIAILLVRYAPERRVEVRAGENRGLVLSYRNIVLGVEKVAQWDGKAPLRLRVSGAASGSTDYPADTRHAILAQQLGKKGSATGSILAAVRLD